MTIIYSTERKQGLEGVYASPSLFNGDTENCSVVYTDLEKIKVAYEAKGVEVRPLQKPKPKPKPKPEIKEETTTKD